MLLTRQFTALCAGLCMFVLTACTSTTPQIESTSVQKETRDLSLLIDAPVRTTMTCRSTRPLSVKNPFKTILFDCETAGLQVSIAELQDAGWRTEAVEIGEPGSTEGVVSMPLTITVKKLF